MCEVMKYDELHSKAHALHYLQNRIEEADNNGYTNLNICPNLNIRVIRNSPLYSEIQAQSKALNTELVAYAATHPYTGNECGYYRCGMRANPHKGSRRITVNSIWRDGRIGYQKIIIYNVEGESNMCNIATSTVSEVAEMANNIALEQGESARNEFITKLIAEYHASLAN